MPELVADRIVQLLQREGAEAIVGFPENRLFNSAALVGMRPIITRTERVAVNIADGFARATNGERFVPCAMQYGPGAEAGFAAVAQAFGDRSPILLLPGEHDVAVQSSSGPELRSELAYAPITRFAATAQRGRARPRDLPARAGRAARAAQRPRARGRRQRRAQRARRRGRLGCEDVAAASDAGERRRRRGDRDGRCSPPRIR